MRMLPRIVAGLAALALTAPAVAPALAAPEPDRTASAEAVVADAPVRGPVRIVTVVEADGRPRVEVTEVPGRDAAVDVVAAAQADPDVVAVEVDTRVSAVQVANPRWNDFFREFQWALDRLSAEDAHARVGQRDPVLVAVIDTGVQSTVTDLVGRVVPGFDYYVPANRGRVDDNGHGTNVAGIITARADNGVQVAGYNQAVRILPIKALDHDGNGWNSDITQGIYDATHAGARVINLSLGGPDYSQAQRQAVAYARSRGVTVVAATGNEKQFGNPVFYPAAYPGVIGVGATDEDDRIGPFSNTGSYVDVVAPGVDIWVLEPDGYGSFGDGTSYASPYAAALAAQLLAARPGLPPSLIETVLTTTAADLGPVGRDNTYGNGIISPLDALCAVGVCGADDPVSRLAGTDRYATAAEIARQFPRGGDVVYVANGQSFPDALAGAALAGSRGAPVVLVRGTSIPSPTAAALSELRPRRIVVLGGRAAVGSDVLQKLRSFATANTADEVRRLAGADRYATAAAIAAEFPAGGEVVYVASGENFPDALAGAALAGSQGAPVVLVRSTGIPSATAAALARLRPQRIVLLGGTAAVREQVREQLRGYVTTGQVTRLSGVDRYATAAAVAAHFPAGGEALYVASGQNFPDALAGAALAGSQGAPVLLVRSDAIPLSTQVPLDALDPQRIVVLGGITSVSHQVARGLTAYVE